MSPAAEIDTGTVPELTDSKSRSTSSIEKDLEKENISVVDDEDEEVLGVIEKAQDVAIQVRSFLLSCFNIFHSLQIISTHDDPSLPSITFRSIFLGIGLSAFASVNIFLLERIPVADHFL